MAEMRPSRWTACVRVSDTTGCWAELEPRLRDWLYQSQAHLPAINPEHQVGVDQSGGREPAAMRVVFELVDADADDFLAGGRGAETHKQPCLLLHVSRADDALSRPVSTVEGPESFQLVLCTHGASVSTPSVLERVLQLRPPPLADDERTARITIRPPIMRTSDAAASSPASDGDGDGARDGAIDSSELSTAAYRIGLAIAGALLSRATRCEAECARLASAREQSGWPSPPFLAACAGRAFALGQAGSVSRAHAALDELDAAELAAPRADIAAVCAAERHRFERRLELCALATDTDRSRALAAADALARRARALLALPTRDGSGTLAIGSNDGVAARLEREPASASANRTAALALALWTVSACDSLLAPARATDAAPAADERDIGGFESGGAASGSVASGTLVSSMPSGTEGRSCARGLERVAEVRAEASLLLALCALVRAVAGAAGLLRARPSELPLKGGVVGAGMASHVLHPRSDAASSPIKRGASARVALRAASDPSTPPPLPSRFSPSRARTPVETPFATPAADAHGGADARDWLAAALARVAEAESETTARAALLVQAHDHLAACALDRLSALRSARTAFALRAASEAFAMCCGSPYRVPDTASSEKADAHDWPVLAFESSGARDWPVLAFEHFARAAEAARARGDWSGATCSSWLALRSAERLLRPTGSGGGAQSALGAEAHGGARAGDATLGAPALDKIRSRAHALALWLGARRAGCTTDPAALTLAAPRADASASASASPLLRLCAIEWRTRPAARAVLEIQISSALPVDLCLRSLSLQTIEACAPATTSAHEGMAHAPQCDGALPAGAPAVASATEAAPAANAAAAAPGARALEAAELSAFAFESIDLSGADEPEMRRASAPASADELARMLRAAAPADADAHDAEAARAEWRWSAVGSAGRAGADGDARLLLRANGVSRFELRAEPGVQQPLSTAPRARHLALGLALELHDGLRLLVRVDGAGKAVLVEPPPVTDDSRLSLSVDGNADARAAVVCASDAADASVLTMFEGDSGALRVCLEAGVHACAQGAQHVDCALRLVLHTSGSGPSARAASPPIARAHVLNLSARAKREPAALALELLAVDGAWQLDYRLRLHARETLVVCVPLGALAGTLVSVVEAGATVGFERLAARATLRWAAPFALAGVRHVRAGGDTCYVEATIRNQTGLALRVSAPSLALGAADGAAAWTSRPLSVHALALGADDCAALAFVICRRGRTHAKVAAPLDASVLHVEYRVDDGGGGGAASAPASSWACTPDLGPLRLRRSVFELTVEVVGAIHRDDQEPLEAIAGAPLAVRTRLRCAHAGLAEGEGALELTIDIDEARWLLCGLNTRVVEAARHEIGSHARMPALAAWDSTEDWLLLPLIPGMLPLPEFVLREPMPSQLELERSTPRKLVRVHQSMAAASATIASSSE